MFKKVLVILVLGFAVFVALGGPVVQARQGCCSGHKGVCGCECCDGKPLSSVCRLNPECGAVVLPVGERGEPELAMKIAWWLLISAIVIAAAIAFLTQIK